MFNAFSTFYTGVNAASLGMKKIKKKHRDQSPTTSKLECFVHTDWLHLVSQTRCRHQPIYYAQAISSCYSYRSSCLLAWRWWVQCFDFLNDALQVFHLRSSHESAFFCMWSNDLRMGREVVFRMSQGKTANNFFWKIKQLMSNVRSNKRYQIHIQSTHNQ